MAERKSLIWNLTKEQLKDMFWDKLLLDKKAIAELCATNEDILRIYQDIGLDFTDKTLNNIPEIEFIYAVDNHEISSYCFPFGTTVTKKTKAPSVDDFMTTIDKAIGWRAFFGDNINRIMLNEHIDELKPLYNKVVIQKGAIKNNLIGLENALKSLQGNETNTWETLKDLDTIEENLYLFSAISSGVFQDAVKSFTDILKTKIWFNSFDISKGLKDKTDNEKDLIVSVFRDCQSTEFAFELFEKWAESVRKKEDTLKNSLEQVIASIANDCHVIDRVLQINKRFADLYESNELSKRYVLLLFSSTNYSTTLRTNPKIDEKLPIIGGRKINIFRSVSQYFLHHLSTSSETDNSKKVQLEIEYLYKLYRIKTFPHPKYDEDTEIIKQNIEKLYEAFLINNSADSYKNFVTTYNGLSAAIGTFKKTLNHMTLDALIQQLTNQIIDVEKSKKIEFLDEALDSLQNYHIYTTAIYRAVQHQIFNRTQLSLNVKPAGDAYIRAINHHLPLLLFFTDYRSAGVHQPLIAITKAVHGAYEETSKEKRDNRIINAVKDYLKTKTPISVKGFSSDEYESRLIYYIIFLILPNADNQNNYKPDYEILKEVEYDLKQLKHYINTGEAKKKQVIIDTYLNFMFVYVWSLRRIGNYDDSTENASEIYTNEALHAQDDPRFYHGIMLNYYCEFRKKIDDCYPSTPVIGALDKIKRENKPLAETLVGYLTLSIKAAYKAIEKYQIKREKKIGSDGWYCENASRPITRSTKFYSAALNSIIYISSFKYYLTDNPDDLDVSKYLRGAGYLKSLETTTTDYPEYQHTEAFLEYCEAVELLNKRQMSEAKNKIECAEKAFEKCLTIDSKYDEPFGLKEKIKEFKVRLTGVSNIKNQ